MVDIIKLNVKIIDIVARYDILYDKIDKIIIEIEE